MKVTDQRTRKDFADCIRELVDVHYPDAEKIVLSERFILEKYEPTDWELLWMENVRGSKQHSIE